MAFLAIHMAPEICDGLEFLEKGLNLTGYVPVIGTITAHGRGFLAVAEICGAVALGIFALMTTIAGNPFPVIIAVSAIKFGAHGVLNIIRGNIECVPFLSLFTCLPYDLVSYGLLGGRIFTYIA